jgi:membrane protease YdiL (CAAX protease family)
MARGSAASRIVVPDGLLAAVRIVTATLAYLAVVATVSLLMYALGLTLVPDSARGTFGLVGLGVAEAAAFAVVLLVWHFLDGRPARELGLRANAARARWLRGAAVAALMMGFVVLVGYTIIDGASWDVNSDGVRAAIVLLAGLLGFLIQGPAEEILFRGYILENVRDQWGLRWAVIVSSLGFGLVHAPNPAFGVLPFINLVFFGAGTALYKVYVDDGQLWGVFAIHTIWNWLQQVVFGLPNSGIASVPTDSLFTVTPNTSVPDPLWGGGFGPEGTLAASFVLLALVGYGLRRARPKSGHRARSSR